MTNLFDPPQVFTLPLSTGQDGVTGLTVANHTQGSGNTLTYPALALTQDDGTSRVLRVAGHNNASSHQNPPPGYQVLSAALSGGGIILLIDDTEGVKNDPTADTQADGTQTQVTMSGADLIMVYNAKDMVPGAAANSTGTDSTAEIPGLSLQVTDGSSKVLCFTITIDADGIWSTPSGLEKVIEYSGGDGGATFITSSGVSSWTGAVSTYSGGSGRWRAVAVELKA